MLTDSDKPEDVTPGVKVRRSAPRRAEEVDSEGFRVMRLRLVVVADFRMSEWTNYEAVVKERPEFATLRHGDVVLLRSGNGKQLVFVHGFTAAGETPQGLKRRALYSERLRLDNGHWSELMIADYAREVGIKLEGLKTLREHFAELTSQLDKDWATQRDEAAAKKAAEAKKAKSKK